MKQLQNIRKGLILLLCLIMMMQAACLASCGNKNPNEKTNEDAAGGQENIVQDDKSEQNNLSNGNKENQYLVRFLTDEGIPISIVECNKGETLIPPMPPRQLGHIFTEWNGEYRNITQNIDIIATYVDVSQVRNAISADTIYVAEGLEFTVIVGIYGDVSFCGLDMDISYDSNVLELIGIVDVDDYVILNDSGAGVIRMNYVTTNNTTGEVAFMTLKFKSKVGMTTETNLQVQVHGIYALNAGGLLIQTGHQVLPNKIIIEEVRNET